MLCLCLRLQQQPTVYPQIMINATVSEPLQKPFIPESPSNTAKCHSFLKFESLAFWETLSANSRVLSVHCTEFCVTEDLVTQGWRPVIGLVEDFDLSANTCHLVSELYWNSKKSDKQKMGNVYLQSKGWTFWKVLVGAVRPNFYYEGKDSLIHSFNIAWRVVYGCLQTSAS